MLKLYKAMTYLERVKHMEPMMSKAFRELAKHLYHDLKEGSRSLERSAQQSSGGYVDGLSMMSQFKLSDDLSLNGSELSLAHSALLGNNNNLETIDELPARAPALTGVTPGPDESGGGVCAHSANLNLSFEQERAKDPRKHSMTMKSRPMKPLSRVRGAAKDRREPKPNADRASEGGSAADMASQTPPALSSPGRQSQERPEQPKGSHNQNSQRKSILKSRTAGDENSQTAAPGNASVGARKGGKNQPSEMSR